MRGMSCIMNKKITSHLLIAAFVIGATTIFNGQINTDYAASSHFVTKTIMHTARIYTKTGQKTTQKYYPYSKVKVSEIPVKLSPQKRTPYYKVKNKNQYLKASNIDGVIRQVCQNTFVYATSSKKVKTRPIKKGTEVLTYGNPFKFKNGQLYYRIGGPAKQYIKASALGQTTGSSSAAVIANGRKGSK